MRERHSGKMFTMLFVRAAICLMAVSAARGQSLSLPEGNGINRSSTSNTSQQVCLRTCEAADSTIPKIIVIGFVGGFAKRDDAKHPEVQFATYLRLVYSSQIHAEVFSNHEGHKALRQVLRLLDADRDGKLTPIEKEQAKIIIYGHSWGASETVAFARDLGQQGIPVRLTIQLDSIAKPGQEDSTIPANVANAVNFYQPRGLLRGRSEISAADPTRTRIIGNFRMTYQNHSINCDNYPWLARTFNKPHHEIENDPRVWNQAASLIDSELSSTKSTATSLRTPPNATGILSPLLRFEVFTEGREH
jgi:pimeloyl-ACP methyl ester carboxylesterase